MLRGPLRGNIEDIVFYWTTAVATEPSVTIHFWGNDSHNSTDLTVVKLWASEAIGPTDFTNEGSGTTTHIHRGHVGNLEIPYADEDNTGEFHVSIQNDLGTAIPAAEWKLEFGFRPEFPA